MKILICGHGEHGKGTFAKHLCQHTGLTVKSSSEFAMERCVIPFLAEHGITYSSPELCYKNRRNHRRSWKESISNYNLQNPARLAQELTNEFDIYDGMRCNLEFEASRNIFDLLIWVDAHQRKPLDPTCKLSATDFHITVDNNGTKEMLAQKAETIANLVKGLNTGNPIQG